MSRNLKITLGILVGAVLLGLLSLHGLHQSVQRLAAVPTSEEQARLAVVAPPISTPTDVNTAAHIFWRSASAADRLDPVDISIPLSADTAVRAKQLLHALIVSAPTEDQKTLPEDITVLGFYVLPDGTGIADFSDGLSSETPSGILSESLAVDFHHSDARKQCERIAPPEDSDSRSRSGYPRRPRGFDGILRHASGAGYATPRGGA